jgi:S-methylmethionine-dependent homocysteine/selenocysteine methylase
VYADFLTAGAQVIAANTFRANLRALRRVGLDEAGAADVVREAVELARAAVSGRPVWVAGSIAPVEDCYRPDLVPSNAELRAEHGWLAEQLVSAGVDLVLCETMNTAREARIALEQVLAAGGRAWVSLVCGDGARLLSGERLVDVGAAVARDGAEAVLVNCTPLAQTELCLRQLRAYLSGMIGAYPNLEDRSHLLAWTPIEDSLPAAVEPDVFAEVVHRWWTELSIDVVGGCCGTTPRHLSALSRQLAHGDTPTSRS